MPIWNTNLHYMMERGLSTWWHTARPLIKHPQIVGYWPGVAHADGRILDFSPNRNHLMNFGATAVTSSYPAHISFSSGSYLELATPPSLTGEFTFGGWFKFAAPTAEMTLISKGTLYDPGDHQAMLIYPAAYVGLDSLASRIADDDEGTYSALFGTAVPLNQWCFLAIGYRLASPYNKYLLQINNWNTELADPDLDLNLGNTLPIRIGTDSSTAYPFTGYAAKLWIVGAALELSDLAAIYTSQLERFS